MTIRIIRRRLRAGILAVDGRLVSYPWVQDAIGSAGDRLYFDEECFLRGARGRFQVDTVIPVSGKGVIVGTADDGATLRDVQTGIGELRGRTKYL